MVGAWRAMGVGSDHREHIRSFVFLTLVAKRSHRRVLSKGVITSVLHFKKDDPGFRKRMVWRGTRVAAVRRSSRWFR